MFEQRATIKVCVALANALLAGNGTDPLTILLTLIVTRTLREKQSNWFRCGQDTMLYYT